MPSSLCHCYYCFMLISREVADLRQNIQRWEELAIGYIPVGYFCMYLYNDCQNGGRVFFFFSWSSTKDKQHFVPLFSFPYPPAS